MADVPGGKLRLHLMSEKALGLSGLPVGKKSKSTGGQSRTAPVRPAVTPPAPARATPPANRPVAKPPSAPQPVVAETAVAAFVANVYPSKTEVFTAKLLSTAQKKIELAQLDEGQVKGCIKCDLCRERTHTVFGEGDVDAKLMFVGEGPGENEDLSGRPFVGRAGELLDRQIAAMGLKREQVFICNVVKCRPPGNRTPTPEEVITCTPYLLKQIEIIRPSAIVTLGLPATKFMLADEKITMGKSRGQWHEWRGIPVRPTYHPAYLLRSYTDANRKMVWDDLQAVMERLGLKPVPRKGATG